jgi:hypothetical protein
MNALLLTLDTKLFLEACEVTILEGDAAQEAVAEVLAGEGLVLEEAS